MNIIVQKFGGSSVATESAREKAVEKIITKVSEGYKVLVVVSAMGRKGSYYSTDTLIKLLEPKAVSNREMDLLLSCGEIISAVVLANHLYLRGHKVPVLSGQQAGIITDDNFGNSEILNVNPHNILKKFKKYQIIIVAGFQGCTKDGDITTLGRGGSDISAIALAQALKSAYVEIYTDVDGVMTADPDIVHDAQIIKNISYPELYYLAKNGAKIVHPKAIKIAQKFNIPLIVKNTYNNNQGTYVSTINRQFVNSGKELTDTTSITSLTYKRGKSLITVSYNKDNAKLKNLMEKLVLNDIKIDIITLILDKIIFIVDMGEEQKITNILEKEGLKFILTGNCCKINAISNTTENKAKTIKKVLKVLYKEGIPVLQAPDLCNSFWCLIKERDMEKALNILHYEFNTNNQARGIN